MNEPMFSGINRRAACRRLLGLAGSASLVMPWLGAVQSVIGADGAIGNTMRIEEDWYIQIGTPEPEADSPQITTVIAPAWTLDGSYGVFDLNCATQPGFSSGGVQLQLWYNGAITQTRSNTNWDSLHFVDEVIRYTSAVSVVDGQIIYEILNGTASSWGTFGTGELMLQRPTWRAHLNGYSPDFSVCNSRIGFASHRVRNFTLERVRYYFQNNSGLQLQRTDDTPRVLHQYTPQT